MGTLMYVVEGKENGFDSIPTSIYWAIVTITTVGFGDIVPGTVLGKVISSVMMLIGYAIIAVPTGIVTLELGKTMKEQTKPACHVCGNQKNDLDADFCKKCGSKLNY